jgi:peptidoglycan/xylan/chitin deacetylase (PgdA/CDA1 family)
MLPFSKYHIESFMFSLLPLDLWHRIVSADLLIPYWHIVSDQELAHISGLYTYRNERQFAEDLEFYLSRYTPVALSDVLRNLDGYGSLPNRSVLFTFDDGFREIYDIIAPLLYRKGIPGVFFPITMAIDNRELCYPQKKSLIINALPRSDDSPVLAEISRRLANAGIVGDDVITRIRSIHYRKRHVLDALGTVLGCDFKTYVRTVQPYLTSEQIRLLLKKGFDIGAHSVDHPRFSELGLEDQLTQIMESIEFISTKFDYRCNTFAFPYTDIGISAELFDRVFSAGSLKATFGSGKLTQGRIPRHLPRFSMERSVLPAARILSRQFGRDLLLRASGNRNVG